MKTAAPRMAASVSAGGNALDLRVSTLPGVHGESIVLRILDRGDLGAIWTASGCLRGCWRAITR